MKLNFIEKGVGEPVVFIHGWATDSNIWQNQLDYFSKKYRVIVPDLRGSGLSAWDEQVASEGMLDEFTKDIDDLFKDLAINSASVVGWSFGGPIALNFAKLYPASVKSLALICTSPAFINKGKMQLGLDKKVIRRLGRSFLKKDQIAIKAFRRSFFTDAERQRTGYKKSRAIFDIIKFDKNAFLKILDLTQKLDISREVRHISAKTFIIAGELDSICPLNASLFMKSSIRDSLLLIIKECGHAPFLTKQDVFNKALEGFLANAH